MNLRTLTVLLAMVLAVGACGTDSGSIAAPSTTTTASPTTTTASPTTTTTASTTTTTTTTSTTVPPTTASTTTTTTIAEVARLDPPDIGWLPITETDTSPVSVAEVATSDSVKIEGYQAVTSMTDAGLGSYSIQVPQGWLWWMLGGDPSDILGIVDDKDPGYATGLADLLYGSAAGDGWHRGLFIDNDAPFLWKLTVIASPVEEVTLDEVHDWVLAGLDGLDILRDNTYPGETGGSIELSARFPAAEFGWSETVITHQAFVLDQDNGLLWGVACSVHESALEETYDACWTSIRTFQPFGVMEGP